MRSTGLRAHSARSWVGENAIHKLAPALSRLVEYEAETIEVDGLAYREGLNAVVVRGGVAGNVIPDDAVLDVNYRFAPSRSLAEASEFVREFFDDYEVTVVDGPRGSAARARRAARAAVRTRGRRRRRAPSTDGPTSPGSARSGCPP